MKAILLTIFFAAAAVAVMPQTRVFEWNDELCYYKGSYKTRKYSAAQLQNTLKLKAPGGFSLNTLATVWKYEEISGLDVTELEREYRIQRLELEKLDIVPVPYWEAVRRAKIKELDQVYELSRVTMMAYKKPEVLRDFKGAEACKMKFAEPIIAGGDALLATWRLVNEDSRKNNSDPERLRRIFDEQNGSPNRLEFALVETMSFGWWNCANEFIEYDEHDENREREFRKLFIKVSTVACDEP